MFDYKLLIPHYLLITYFHQWIFKMMEKCIQFIFDDCKNQGFTRFIDSALATKLQLHLSPQSHWQQDESLWSPPAVCTCTLVKQREISQCPSPFFLSHLHFRSSRARPDRYCTPLTHLATTTMIQMGRLALVVNGLAFEQLDHLPEHELRQWWGRMTSP